MTILTKSSFLPKKPDVTKSPLVNENVPDETRIEIHVDGGRRGKRKVGWIIFGIIMTGVFTISTLCSLLALPQQPPVSRYKGVCAVPLSDKKLELADDMALKPQFWSSSDTLDPIYDETMALTEDISIDQNTETISIMHDGRQVSFINDFNNNYTGIVDGPRCWVSSLQRSLALSPDVFVVRISEDAPFDVSRVLVAMRAVLPALALDRQQAPPALRRLHQLCAPRPIYRLMPETVRKRSVEDEKPDYMQFLGKHVQEFKIANLDAVLEYEKNKSN